MTGAKQGYAVILHNIRSAHNVGSIFRTADGAGVARIFLSGYTPTPIDRFGREQKQIAKVALGAEKHMPWERCASLSILVARLRKDGWRIVGVEQDSAALDHRTYAPAKRSVFVFGNEVRGLSKQARALCDDLIEIPMVGEKESLNVAVAAGIVLYNPQQPS